MNALEQAISHPDIGNQSALADRLGVTQPTISEWLCGKRPIPAKHAAEIERITHGAVTCDRLLPDAHWRRMKDRAWPWNGGRPMLDVTNTGVA